MGILRAFVGFLVFSQFLSACASRSRAPDELGDDLGRKSLREAVARSLGSLARMPGQRVLGEWPRKVTVADLQTSLLEFEAVLAFEPESDAEWLERVAERFDFYSAPVTGTDDGPLFTGYYQPVLEASLIETDTYRYPLYGFARAEHMPDPSTLTRHEIDGLGKLAGHGYEIAWLKDPVERFFMHIQGSGLLELPDGSRLYANFAASNDRPYTSIGKVLINAGKLDRDSMSMQQIRCYLAEHPDEMDELFAMNERYVFFRIADLGPVGSLGVPLTKGRSIATDPDVYPPGGLAFIEIDLPVADEQQRSMTWRPTKRFVMNQDTGAAIRGPNRVDLYFGTGPVAGEVAGVMKRRGQLYFLLRKQSAECSGPAGC
jgi:membrane-bound lytic murein transglycosylase A